MRRMTTVRWCVKGLKRDYNRLFEGLTGEELDMDVENFEGVDDGGSPANEIATFEFLNEISDGVDEEGLIGERVRYLAKLALDLCSTPDDGTEINPDDPVEWLTQIDFVPCVGSVVVGKLAWVFACYRGQYALARSTRQLAFDFQPDSSENAETAMRFLAACKDAEALFGRFHGVEILAGLLAGPCGEEADAEMYGEFFSIPMPSPGETGRVKASVLAGVPEQAFEYDEDKVASGSSDELFERALVNLLSDHRRQADGPYGS